MPKEFSHILLAEILVSRFRSTQATRTAEMLTRHSWAYYAGSLAPDALYYDFPDPTYLWLPRSTIHVARRLHQAAGISIYSLPLSLLAELRGGGIPSEVHLAFILGFMCHLATDMTFHPIIIRFIRGRSPDSGREATEHLRLESVLDEILYGHFGRSLAQTNLLRSTCACSSKSAEVTRFYARGLTALGMGSDGDLHYALKRAFCKQLWLNRLFQLPAFFRLSRWLSQRFHGRFETYHALAHPHLDDCHWESSAHGPWRWAVQSWGSVPVQQVIEICLLRAEFLVRTALRYLTGRLSRKEAEEAFLRVTPATGVRGHLSLEDE
jgi:hypothetical protein